MPNINNLFSEDELADVLRREILACGEDNDAARQAEEILRRVLA